MRQLRVRKLGARFLTFGRAVLHLTFSSHISARKRSQRRRAFNTTPPPVGSRPTALEDLGDDELRSVLQLLPFPGQLLVSATCRRWRDLCHESPRRVAPGQSLAEAIAACPAGATLMVPPGLYQETLLILSPLKLVVDGLLDGAVGPPAASRATVFTARPPAAVCNARVRFVGFEFHVTTSVHDLSVVAYGPNCKHLCLERCVLSGATGMLLPPALGSAVRLDLQGCEMHGMHQGMAAVNLMAGTLNMVDCVVHGCAVGLDTGRGTLAVLSRCVLRFNRQAFMVDGRLALEHCRLLGNTRLANAVLDAKLRIAVGDIARQMKRVGAGQTEEWLAGQQMLRLCRGDRNINAAAPTTVVAWDVDIEAPLPTADGRSERESQALELLHGVYHSDYSESDGSSFLITSSSDSDASSDVLTGSSSMEDGASESEDDEPASASD